MKLIGSEDIFRIAKLKNLGGEGIAGFLMLVLKFNKINKLYSKTYHINGIGFIDAVLKELDLKYEVSDEDLSKIPEKGPFIIISNHPYGGIDGLLLIKMIGEKRPDFRMVSNFLLQRIEPVRNFILPPFHNEASREKKLNPASVEKAGNHLKEGKPLGVFPAGTISGVNEEWTEVTDRQWQYPMLRFLKQAEVPIVPVYFRGTNSRIFHMLGLIHPMLRNVKLPSELFNKKKKVIKIRIGSPVNVKDQNEMSDISRFGRFLRAKTYAMGTTMEIKKFFNYSLRRSPREEPVIEPVPEEKISAEIEKIKKNYLLFKSGSFFVCCAPTMVMPNLTLEIGRLREITFRDVGEGTNRKIDIDEFDLYYNQLFVWDDEARKIAGAYRVGKGKEIMDKYGVKGFYIQSLFKIHRKFYPVLSRSIELGRSFIIKEYQKKPMPLFLLWKGILYFLIKNPEYRYLLGPVTISNRFSNFSKSVIIEFVKKNYYNKEFAKYIKPRNNFRVKITNVDTSAILGDSDDISKLDKFISDIEPSSYHIPVLLKKYLKTSGKIIGFNIDPKFNNALDGLLIMDLYDVPMETITSLSKEISDKSLLDRFTGKWENDLD